MFIVQTPAVLTVMPANDAQGTAIQSYFQSSNMKGAAVYQQVDPVLAAIVNLSVFVSNSEAIVDEVPTTATIPPRGVLVARRLAVSYQQKVLFTKTISNSCTISCPELLLQCLLLTKRLAAELSPVAAIETVVVLTVNVRAVTLVSALSLIQLGIVVAVDTHTSVALDLVKTSFVNTQSASNESEVKVKPVTSKSALLPSW